MNIRKLKLGIATVVAATLGAVGASLLGASPALAGGDSLMPDPEAYCIMNPPYAMQQEVNDFKVVFTSLDGDRGKNNWKCTYLVQMTVPTGRGDFVLPPSHQSFGVDWNAMCNEQYPGAHAQWIPGPLTGVRGAPWGCIGATGVTYDLAEKADGTHDVLSRGNGGGGW